ncbi:hypothetical protein N5D77_12075 [Comamonas thiooxydans]|uniref:Uncharacterized protein n=1 Tax=Comamonas thiooxydans TaxID=363952 RepID=A0AA42Q0M3_9BURK|nr:hypothetical protein [Comamonas thiooxydans]MDH1334960.1 hypothetical protein [Comamonas thiooxydans]MDH1740959.1 hypothetical protein [Comamonas thiooxydans]MDH1787306.1 hypothetical protein [Comamonas thiooxydans]
MKKLSTLTKEELKRLYEIIGNKYTSKKTGKERYYLNTIVILEYFWNVFKFDSDDYQTFLLNKFWIENKEVFTDGKDKKILSKISDNIYKLIEIKY